MLFTFLTIAFSAVEAAEPAPLFIDQTHMMGAPGAYGDYGVLWADLDGDERLDLVFSNHLYPLQILRQQSDGRFVDMQGLTGIETTGRDRHGASCADYDNDGDLDLLFSNGADQGVTLGRKHDELWLNDQGFRFSEHAERVGVQNEGGRGRSGHWADVNRDGRLDIWSGNYRSPARLYLYLTDDRFETMVLNLEPPVSGPIGAWSDFDRDGDPDIATTMPLRLLRNDGAAGFADVRDLLQPSNQWARGLAWGDVDNDGDSDLLVMVQNGSNELMINREGRFYALTSLRKDLQIEGLRAAAWGDLDNDGDLDAILSGDAGSWLLLNQGGLRFEPLRRLQIVNPDSESPENLTARESGPQLSGEALSGPFGMPALADYDRDGYLDVAMDSIKGNRLLRNAGGTNHWLQLELRGYSSNRQGVGARVELRVQGNLLAMREHFGAGNGSLSNGCEPMHFGLGQRSSADLIVYWPSGARSEIVNVGANQLITLVEPDRRPLAPE